MSPRKPTTPGSVYLNGNRYWWRVRLPGEDKHRSRPLIPVGSQFATADPAVAREVARMLWQNAVLAQDPAQRGGPGRALSLGGLAAAYSRWARSYYRTAEGRQSSEAGVIRSALLHLAPLANLPAAEFDPARLAAVRDGMIAGGVSRSTIVHYLGRIRRMFSWGADPERSLVLPATADALTHVAAPQPGRSAARETEPVGAVADPDVQAVLPLLPGPLAAMVQVQLYTAARSGELCRMRPMDIDASGAVWLYRPVAHKTSHRGRQRIIAIGPRAQRIIRPLLEGAALDGPVFRHGQPAIGYTPGGYWRAIGRAVEAVNRTRRAELLAAGECDEAAIERAMMQCWHPHQLRHSHATRVRRARGLDSARAVLGHATLAMADEYAELDIALAVKAAKLLG